MVAKYRNILVAVDGSEQSRQAVKETVKIAKRNEAYLTVLTVTDTNIFAADAHIVSYILEQAEISSKNILENAEKIILNEVIYGTQTLNGNPKACIVQFAKENRIDLIVMGATGKGAIARVLVGSTTAYVVNHAPCNVLVVR